MDLRKLKKLIDLVQDSGIAELEITEGEERVRITRSVAAAPIQYAPPTIYAQAAVPAAPEVTDGPAPTPAAKARPIISKVTGSTELEASVAFTKPVLRSMILAEVSGCRIA